MRDHQAISKQMGLVNFTDAEAAKRAITNHNNKPFPGNESQQALIVTFYKELDRMLSGK